MSDERKTPQVSEPKLHNLPPVSTSEHLCLLTALNGAMKALTDALVQSKGDTMVYFTKELAETRMLYNKMLRTL